MTYLAITEATASWLLGKPGLLDGLHEVLVSDKEAVPKLAHREFAEGAVRIAASRDASVIAFWNVEYASGTGDDRWGFLALDSPTGLRTQPGVSRGVLERCLRVISQRLQGLLVEGAWLDRPWPNGVHTCDAGVGSVAGQLSIGYVERDVPDASTVHRTLLLVGPHSDPATLSDEAAHRAESLSRLLPTARKLYDPARTKEALHPNELVRLRQALRAYGRFPKVAGEFGQVNVPTGEVPIDSQHTYRTIGWTYSQWLDGSSPLSSVQRSVLESDAIKKHPIRILGPGGSGKTLLMQLLALRQLDDAAQDQRPLRVLYLVHNTKMAQTVRYRFDALEGPAPSFLAKDRVLQVTTLSEYGRRELGLDETFLIDPDAHEAKKFQLEVLENTIQDAFAADRAAVRESRLLQQVSMNSTLHRVFANLVMSEISRAIKGHGLGSDERRYVQSERPLSRFHAVLTPAERHVVFSAYRRYQGTIFDEFGVLDSDDVALSLLGKLRTPIWELKRRELGFDHVFVDETQLFNENERRVLPLLTRRTSPYVPVVLALDEAQDLYGQASAGLAALGIENVANENLSSIHRSSKSIIRLAFFVIQRSTDLFGPDFPSFTHLAEEMPDDTNPLAVPPRAVLPPDAHPSVGRNVLKRIRALRKTKLFRLAVVCIAEQYWDQILEALRDSDLPLHVMEARGERLEPNEPTVVLSRPPHIGGQEFDAVVIAGAEEGLAPPRVMGNEALSSAVEQQALREMYLAITRARYQVIFALASGASLTKVLVDAQKAGLLHAALE